MGDNGQKDKKTEKWSGNEAYGKKEKAPSGSIGSLFHQGKRKGEKRGNHEKTSGIKREILESEVIGSDKETVEKIATLDTSKEIREQKDKWDRLEFVSYTFLPKLFDKGFKPEVLQVLDSFRSIQVPEAIPLNGAEKVALKKLKEISSQTSSPLFNDLKEKWGAVVKRAQNAYKKAAEARDYLNKPTTSRNHRRKVPGLSGK